MHSGEGGKSAPDVALLRATRTGEQRTMADFPKSGGVVSTRRKVGSLRASGRHSLFHRLWWILIETPGPIPKRFELHRPPKRQIDPTEQRLGVEFGGLSSLADRLDDSGATNASRERRST